MKQISDKLNAWLKNNIDLIRTWDNKNNIITNKRIRITDDYVTDTKLTIPFDERLFQVLKEDTSYEIRINDIPVTIYKSYKSGKWLVIDYNGGK